MCGQGVESQKGNPINWRKKRHKDDEWGEEVKLVVELNEGYRPDDEMAKELLAFAAENLPGYQRPRSVDFVKELPRMPSGKVLRRNIRDAYWQGEKKI